MTDAILAPVFDYLEAQREVHLARFLDYLRHPSISAQNIGIREVAGILNGWLSNLGLDSEIVETAGHPMVLARRTENPASPTILLYGHYDVQPPEPLDAWTSPPFEPAIRDGRIWARGAGDNKGQHFAQILAIEAHLKIHGRLPCNVVVLLEGEEEVGSPHIAQFVRDHADRLRADLAVIADGPMHDSGAALVVFGVRGMVSFDLKVRTATHDTHSGNYGGVMPNAAWTLVHLLATMKTPDGRITIEGLHDPIRPPTADERAAAAALPLDLPRYMAEAGLTRLDRPVDRPFQDRLMFHPTLTINGFHSGYEGEGSKAVLPAKAVVKCDIRLVPDMTPEQVLSCVRAHVARFAPEVEVIGRAGMLPSKTPLDSPFAAPVIAASRIARGRDPLIVPVVGGSLPNYIFGSVLKIPAFTTPYANFDEANHAPDENIGLDCFFAGIRNGAALLATIGAMR